MIFLGVLPALPVDFTVVEIARRGLPVPSALAPAEAAAPAAALSAVAFPRQLLSEVQGS